MESVRCQAPTGPSLRRAGSACCFLHRGGHRRGGAAASGFVGVESLQRCRSDHRRRACRTHGATDLVSSLTELYLERIRAYDHTGPALNAVQTVNPNALQEADRLDRAFATGGPVGPLHCVPVLVKDQLDTNDIPTTHGFAGFTDFVPQTDATVVTKLRNAGALIIGKATMGEFASGYISSASGPIRNASTLAAVPAGRRAAPARALRRASQRSALGRIPADRSAARPRFTASWA